MMLIEKLERLKLDRNERAGMINAMRAVMAADGKIDDREVALIDEIAKILEVDLDKEQITTSFPDASDKATKVNLLGLLYLVSYVDESKHEKEEQVIRDIVKDLDFSDEDFVEADKKARLYILEGFLLKNIQEILFTTSKVQQVAELFDLNDADVKMIIEDIIKGK